MKAIDVQRDRDDRDNTIITLENGEWLLSHSDHWYYVKDEDGVLHGKRAKDVLVGEDVICDKPVWNDETVGAFLRTAKITWTLKEDK